MKEFNLSLTAERSVVRESLKGVIWTIFFNRVLGPISPTTVDFFNVTYPMASNLYDLDSIIDEKINQLIKAEFDHIDPNRSKNGKIIIKFLDPKSKKVLLSPSSASSSGGGIGVSGGGWFTSSPIASNQNQRIDEYTWEIWHISVECFPVEQHDIQGGNKSKTTTDANTSTSRATSSYAIDQVTNPKIKYSIQSLESNLIQIYKIIESNLDNVPPITSTASIPYPYAIIVDQTTTHQTESPATTSATASSNQWWK